LTLFRGIAKLVVQINSLISGEKFMRQIILALSLVITIMLIITRTVFAATITVTSFADSGPNTLRLAIATASSGDTIDFFAPGNSITVYSPLVIDKQLIIVGGGTTIGAQGTNTVFSVLTGGANSEFHDLAIVDGQSGFFITVDNVQILGCRIGTDFADATGRGNNFYGIQINGGDNIRIGDSTSGNVIVSSDYGISLTDCAGTIIQNNSIGLASDGVTPIPIGNDGVWLGDQTWNCLIGGNRVANQGNVISGNGASGIRLAGSDSGGNTICGNIIGLTAAGAAGVGNSNYGIYLGINSGNWIGLSTDVGYGNYIAGNGDRGIYLVVSDNNSIQNNIIGLDFSGNAAPHSYGIFVQSGTGNLIGGNRGTGALEKNVISGNTAYNVYLNLGASSNSVCGNFIGTSVDGSSGIVGASAHGFLINGSGNLIGGPNTNPTTMYGNLISGHSSSGHGGLLIQGSGNTVVGNYLGLDVTGTTAIPNYHGIIITSQNSHGNLIGSTDPDLRNIISGNNADGMWITNTYDNTIIGNHIGLNLTADNTLENTTNGIRIDNSDGIVLGGLLAGEANYISGSISGINLSTNATNNTIVGNFIGVYTDLTPSNDPPFNGIYGNGCYDNFIGYKNTGQGNLIANCAQGIRLGSTAVRVNIYGNTICANSAPDIQLLTGANNDNPRPVITGAYTTYITGTSDPNNYIEIFIAESGVGPGGSLSYVGNTTADGSGNWTLNVPSVSLGDWVCATATDATNDGTSEFSLNDQVTLPPTPTYTSTASPTSTNSATYTPTFTHTPTGTITPTITNTPTVTPTPTISATYTSSPTVTVTPSVTTTYTSTATEALGAVDLRGKRVLSFPNPARDLIKFLMHLDATTKVELTIYNLAGEQVAYLAEELPAGRGQVIAWNCSAIAPGIYLVRVMMDGEEKEVQKIAVIK
jgi:parallel beta-helix repeat protein